MNGQLKKVGLRVFFTAMLVTGLLGCTRTEKASSQAKSVLILGLSADYPPFEFKKNGEIVGFDVDVAKAVTQEMGVELSIQDMDFSALIPALQTGRIDFAMSAMAVTEERKRNVEFSETYFNSAFALLVKKENSLSKEEEFSGKKIGVQLGTTLEKYAKEQAKKYTGMQVVSLNKYPVLIEEVKAGRMDGVIAEQVQAMAFVEANPALRFSVLSTSYATDGYAIAFPRNSEKGASLRDQFNSVLKKLQTSGELEKLKTKWFAPQR